jgi:hypothetical protein
VVYLIETVSKVSSFLIGLVKKTIPPSDKAGNIEDGALELRKGIGWPPFFH